MSEKFVTVAKFGMEYEAQLARSLLANEGIEAVISGDQTGSLLAAPSMLGGIIELQVHEEQAPRASGILSAAAGATLDDDWETRAEEGAGVWVCSLCGSPISNLLSRCHACDTPRDSIRSGRPGDSASLQTAPAIPSVPPREEITDTPSRATQTPPEDDEPFPVLPRGDALARRAFTAGMLALVFPPLVLYSIWLLGNLAFVDEELTPTSMRRFYWTIILDALVGCLWLAFSYAFSVIFWPG